VATLLLLRHGESEWNATNRFTGWVDVEPTARGEEQARHSGRRLREAGLLPTVLHTSLLTRAVRTGTLAVAAAGRAGIPVHRTWRLNERHYGALQGLDRTLARARYGDEQFRRWRHSYDAQPPPVEPGSRWDVAADPRYAGLGRVPRSESLLDVQTRLLPHWDDVIVPDLRGGHTVLITAHGNSLRALIAHLDRLTSDEALRLDVPTGMPLHYALDANLSPTLRGGQYLDPDDAAQAAAEVAGQGQ
jgi:2,3-bisphosphoglycerate-dependent phosphoglycerate mutase